MRPISERELIHERLGDRFEACLSVYDTERRLTVLIDEFFGDIDLRGRSVLEVGCGLGFFTRRLCERGANVIATDIGEQLLAKVRENVGRECLKVDALALSEYFGRDRFDAVLSSECIEHTPSPNEALREMARVSRSGGYISLARRIGFGPL